MNENIINELKKIVGEDWVVTKKEVLQGYLLDETAEPVRPKPTEDIVVVKPKSAQEIAEILKLANRERIPVFTRGGGTGLVGGCIPTQSSIVISMERMDKIEVDKENLMAVAEAGVTLGTLIEKAEEAGLFFPAHPGDEGAHIGGLVACNAGGARAVKTGVMRNYVVGLDVVTPTGEILNIGGKLIKNNTSKLLHLFIGTEGILGIITKAIIRLSPQYKATATMVVPFKERHTAVKTAPKILQSGIIPLGLEYVEKELIETSAKHLGMEWPCKEGNAFLIVILAEFDEETVYSELEKISEICTKNGSLEPLLAETSEEQNKILKIRSEIYIALKPNTIDILDIVVPISKVGEFMDEMDRLAKKYDTYIPAYGHIGDGNLHPHVMRKEGWTMEQYKELKKEIYNAAKKLGGTLTGEHGIGAIRLENLRAFLSDEEIELMRKIKKIFDPNNILNPGRVIL